MHRPASLERQAWWPIPLLIAAYLLLSTCAPQVQFGSPFLLGALNFVFSLLTSLAIVILVGRNYVVRGAAGLLLLGCGVLAWGLSGVAPGWRQPVT